MSGTNRARWIKPAGSTYAPRCVVSVVVETEHIGRQFPAGMDASQCKRIHVAISSRPGLYWSQTKYLSFDDTDSFHNWLENFGSKRRRTYVFTHSVMDTLLLTRFFDRLQNEGCRLVEYSDGAEPSTRRQTDLPAGPTDGEPGLPARSVTPSAAYSISAFIGGINASIVRYRKDSRTFQWCSHSQYCQSKESDIAAFLGHQWTDEQDSTNQTPNQYHSEIERCHLWCKYYQHLSDWWIDIDGGPWGATVAAMSYSFLRRRLTPKTVLRHNNEEVGLLEEGGIFAGRRSVWYVGNIGSETKWSYYGQSAPNRSTYGQIDRDMIHHDIRSMYPYLLSCMPYPVKLLEHRAECDISTLRDALASYGVIARVLIRSDVPEYPVRTPSGIIYPIGQYHTTLCGAELMDALGNDRVIHCGSTAIYKMGTPFKSACESLLQMRILARQQRQDSWGQFVKTLSNSMSGRIAQMPYNWVPRPDVVPLTDWGPWSTSTVGSADIQRYRSMSGMVWERVLASSKIRPMGAAYAYLTCYGRWLMGLVRKICPEQSVISQDTDGIWCLPEATRCLYTDGVIDGSMGGDLHWTKLSPVGRFYGSQHYWYGAGWVMSGSNVVAQRPKSDTIVVSERMNTVATARSLPDPIVYQRYSERTVGRISVPGEIDALGWVKPVVLWQE